MNGLALLDFSSSAEKLSYSGLFKVHLFSCVFQRLLSADKSPQYLIGQALRLHLLCRSVKKRKLFEPPFKCFACTRPFWNHSGKKGGIC